MRQDSLESVQHAVDRPDHRDSQNILDLINQLDLDLAETEKDASERE